jgi:hypothetical protein
MCALFNVHVRVRAYVSAGVRAWVCVCVLSPFTVLPIYKYSLNFVSTYTMMFRVNLR